MELRRERERGGGVGALLCASIGLGDTNKCRREKWREKLKKGGEDAAGGEREKGLQSPQLNKPGAKQRKKRDTLLIYMYRRMVRPIFFIGKWGTRRLNLG